MVCKNAACWVCRQEAFIHVPCEIRKKQKRVLLEKTRSKYRAWKIGLERKIIRVLVIRESRRKRICRCTRQVREIYWGIRNQYPREVESSKVQQWTFGYPIAGYTYRKPSPLNSRSSMNVAFSYPGE